MVSNGELFHLLNQRKRLLNKKMNDSLKPFGLYASQWSILFCVNQFGRMSQTDIWKYLNVEAPTMTRTLVRMEKSGWIVRKPGKDKRERMIELTEKAKQKLPAIQQEVSKLEEGLLEQLTIDDKDKLYQLLNKIGETGENASYERKNIGKDLDKKFY